MRCGDCKHYEHRRNTETNRPLPSRDGNCTYPVEWPELPKSFLPDKWTHYGNAYRVEYPQRRPVWRYNEEPCAMFEEKTKKQTQLLIR